MKSSLIKSPVSGYQLPVTSYNVYMIEILTVPVGQMQSNCYIIFDESIKQCLVIDPGDDWEYLVSQIQEKNLVVSVIIATHGHFDHIMGVFPIQKTFNVPFMIHKDDEFLLQDMRSSARHFLNIEAGPAPIADCNLKEKEAILLSANKFEVVHTPGHTPGSICLYNKKDKILFTGDLVFAEGGVGRTDFSYSNQSELEKSIARVFKLPKDTIIYPGHGPSTTIGDEIDLCCQ
jgi:hydroxyacylglutathione hydrolase